MSTVPMSGLPIPTAALDRPCRGTDGDGTNEGSHANRH